MTHAVDSNSIAVRWLIRRDIDEALAIDRLVYPDYPWNKDDLLHQLRQRNCIGVVAEISFQSPNPGYMVYSLYKAVLRLVRIAVDPDCEGVGEALVGRLKDKLSQQCRRCVLASVCESDLPLQLLLQSCGFRVEKTEKGKGKDRLHDAYLFAYRI